MSDVVSNPNQNPTSAAALAAAAEGTQIVIQADRDGTDDPTITGSSTVRQSWARATLPLRSIAPSRSPS